MSKEIKNEIKNIGDDVMNQIHGGKLKMRSKLYFIIGSILTFVGLVASTVLSTFLVGLIRFSVRSHGPMGGYRLDQILSSFPWWAPILAIVGLVVGVWLLHQYDFSYKINFKVIIAGFILAIIVGGWIVDSIGLNDVLIRRGPMQGMMRQYMQDRSDWGGSWRN